MSEPAAAKIEKQPDVVVLRVSVLRLDEDGLRRLQTEIHAAAAESPQLPLVIDLSEVEFLSSLALAAFIRLASDFRERRQRLMLSGLRPDVRQVFVLTRLDRLFEMFDDVAAATRTIRPA
jgi:anti-anti-sigma factor